MKYSRERQQGSWSPFDAHIQRGIVNECHLPVRIPLHCTPLCSWSQVRCPPFRTGATRHGPCPAAMDNPTPPPPPRASAQRGSSGAPVPCPWHATGAERPQTCFRIRSSFVCFLASVGAASDFGPESSLSFLSGMGGRLCSPISLDCSPWRGAGTARRWGGGGSRGRRVHTPCPGGVRPHGLMALDGRTPDRQRYEKCNLEVTHSTVTHVFPKADPVEPQKHTVSAVGGEGGGLEPLSRYRSRTTAHLVQG